MLLRLYHKTCLPSLVSCIHCKLVQALYTQNRASKLSRYDKTKCLVRTQFQKSLIILLHTVSYRFSQRFICFHRDIIITLILIVLCITIDTSLQMLLGLYQTECLPTRASCRYCKLVEAPDICTGSLVMMKRNSL